MVGGYQIIDLDKYVGKKITQEQYDYLTDSTKHAKPVVYKATNYGVTMRTSNVLLIDSKTNTEVTYLYLEATLIGDEASNLELSSSHLCVKFTAQNDDTFIGVYYEY